MKYYIKCGLAIRLENSWLLPGAVDLQVGAILADDNTNLIDGYCEPRQRIGGKVRDSLPAGLPNDLRCGDYFV